MKLLTLNTHSLEEPDMEQKQDEFVSRILAEGPDVIALQEVNQTMDAAPAADDTYGLVWKPEGAILKVDNHGWQIARKLKEAGLDYTWAWLPMKIGYDKYDEGMAIFSRKPILDVKNLLASRADGYADFRTRRILAIETEDGWFCSIHLSWWEDAHEPFRLQWERLEPMLKELASRKLVVLMGDFNSDAFLSGESADLMREDGYFDTYVLADAKDEGYTVGGIIDGWEDHPETGPKRIDQIWLSQNLPVESSEVVFNGQNGSVLSDHYGLLVDLRLPEENRA